MLQDEMHFRESFFLIFSIGQIVF